MELLVEMKELFLILLGIAIAVVGYILFVLSLMWKIKHGRRD